MPKIRRRRPALGHFEILLSILNFLSGHKDQSFTFEAIWRESIPMAINKHKALTILEYMVEQGFVAKQGNRYIITDKGMNMFVKFMEAGVTKLMSDLLEKFLKIRSFDN